MPTSKRAAWYQTLRAHTALIDLMDRDLRAATGYPLAFYDVMVELWHSPGHSLRMSDLADRVLLSRSWVTRRIEQLERAGLVARQPAQGDERGVVAQVTPAGARAFAAMERQHATSIEEHFSRFLDARDSGIVARRFAAMADNARARLRESG